MRLAFMGTPAFSVPALSALLKAGHEIEAVYTQPPRPAGRGKKLQPSAVHQAADRLGIPVRHPASLRKDPAVLDGFKDLRLDAAVVVAYGMLLPQEFLDVPRFGCLNIHASMLPRWRGAAPIQRAIEVGDAETGVAIIDMEVGLDTGPVYLAEPVPILHRTTAGDLHDDLARLGGRLIVEVLDSLEREGLKPRPQPSEGVTYAEKITKAEAEIDWLLPAGVIDRKVRAFTPWPGSWFMLGKDRVKVLRAAPAPNSGTHLPGTVLKADPLIVACGDDALRLIEVQRPGKGAISGGELARALDLVPGQLFIAKA